MFSCITYFPDKNVAQCPEYPVLSYTYLVENATTLINITEAARDVTIDGLRENSRYHYQILASNQFGYSPPATPVEIGKLSLRTYLAHVYV
jgi:hypothetical protein